MRRLTWLPGALTLLLTCTAVADDAKTLAPRIDADAKYLVSLYEQLHAHPELAFQEEQTAARLAKELRQAGFTVTEKVGGTGIVGVLKNGPGPTLLVRADMDGLPIVERTGLKYASKVRTRDKDGQDVGTMHACGHDINVTCLVGVARLLNQIRDRWQGTLVFIGQPAEEIGAGARKMLDDGLLTRFPRPDYALALHCDGRHPHGTVTYRLGQMQANVDSVDILVRGRGGHGSTPEATIDPIVLAARIILDLQTLISRERSPQQPGVITVGSIHGGAKHNVIPNEVKLQLTVRSLTDLQRKEMLEGIARLAKAAALGARAPEPTVTYIPESFTPSLVNQPELGAKMAALLKKALGAERVIERPLSLGGEDFSQFVRAGIPGFYFFLGTVPPERYQESLQPGGKQLPSTHSDAYFPVPEPTIRTGVQAMTALVLELVGKK